MIRSLSIAVLCGLALLARPAEAALTPSEQAQIRGFVMRGDPGDAARVRALVARPDLDASEAAGPLIGGFARVAFDDRHARFAEALLFGPGSGPSRSALVGPVVQALLARAEKIVPSASDRADHAALAELVRIHAFVDAKVANAGHPPFDGHDASAEIRDDAYEDAAKSYKAHFDRLRSWLGFGDAGPARVRAQAAATLIDLCRGVVPRHQLVTWLGLSGARGELFERTGVLLVDGGGVPEARVALFAQLIGVSPRAGDGAELWLIDKASPVGLSAAGAVVRAGADAGSSAAMDPGKLWPAEVDPARIDATLAEVAYSVALRAARRALAGDAKLAQLATAAAARARDAGDDGYLARDLPASMIAPAGAADIALEASPVELVARSLRLVLVDAPRAITIALARARAGRPEPTEQLLLALSALWRTAAADNPTELPVGRATAAGSVALDKIDQIQVVHGVVVSFRYEKHRLDVLRASDGRITGATLDGAAPKLAAFGVYRLVPRPGPWTVAGVRLQAISGDPRAAVGDDGHLVFEPAASSGGFDAATTGESVAAPKVHAKLRPTAEGGGLIVAAAKSPVGYTGIALFIGGTPQKALFARVEASGRAVQLGDAIELPAPRADGAYDVKLDVAADRVVATIDGKHLETKTETQPGQVGVTVRRGGKLELWSLAVTTPAHGAKKK